MRARPTRLGGEGTIIPALIGVDEDAQRLVQGTIETYGRLDIIYSNAGSGSDGNVILDEPSDELDRMLDHHIKGPMQLCRAAWPHLTGQNYGRILFTGSITGTGYFKSSPRGPEGAYSVCKAAAFTMCRNYGMAGEPHNIKANLVMPMAYSNMVATQIDPDSPFSLWMQANLRAEQVANSILYLLHEDCPVYGEAFSSGGGRVSRCFFAETLGYFNPDLTPEDVVDNWGQVMGGLREDGTMDTAFEVSQPREEALMGMYLEKKDSPEIDELVASLHVPNDIPLKQQNLAT